MKRYAGKNITWKDFPKFAGKDAWILVYSYDINRDLYLKVNEIADDLSTMTCCYIGTPAVLNPIYEDDYNWFLDCMFKTRTEFPERFTVLRPLEILSTDEILEALRTDMISE